MFGFCANTGRNRLLAAGIKCTLLTREDSPLTAQLGGCYRVSSIAHTRLWFAVERPAIASHKE